MCAPAYQIFSPTQQPIKRCVCDNLLTVLQSFSQTGEDSTVGLCVFGCVSACIGVKATQKEYVWKCQCICGISLIRFYFLVSFIIPQWVGKKDETLCVMFSSSFLICLSRFIPLRSSCIIRHPNISSPHKDL